MERLNKYFLVEINKLRQHQFHRQGSESVQLILPESVSRAVKKYLIANSEKTRVGGLRALSAQASLF
jgi:hypothetical protein